LLPLPVVVGSFVASIGCHIIANPILVNGGILQRFGVHGGILKHWVWDGYAQSQVVNSFDFWLSFGIGTSVVVAVIGIISVIRALAKANSQKQEGVAAPQFSVPKGGDIPV
jgi:hypothetical protein